MSLTNEHSGLLYGDREGRVELAYTTAEEFSKLYYNTLDKCRHKLPKLYMADACLVWNGNGVAGNEDIAQFYKNLPISETTIFSLDTQPIMAVEGRMTILVLTAGTIKFGDKSNPFQQNFVLTVHEEIWKIVTDTFRFQETL